MEGTTQVVYGQIYNLGILDVQEFLLPHYSLISGSYRQNNEDVELIVRGNFSATESRSCNITAGVVVFDGSEQQTVKNLEAYNVEVLNTKGIKYLSDIYVYGNYDLHGNPFDCGNYKTNFYENGSFGTLECNQSDWIVDKEPSDGKPGSKHIECLICHEIVKQEEISVLLGDLNGDFFVNTTDVVVLRRYIAGGYEVSIIESMTDLNGDGYINTTDVVTLRRYIAGGYGIVLK